MKEEIISYETAKLAKEKGFNINCLYYGYLDSDYIDYSGDSNGKVYGFNGLDRENRIMYPTQSQLQKWLRETHRINIFVKIGYSGKQSNEIWKWIGDAKGWDYVKGGELVYSYEEALEKGLQEALKLI